MAAYFHTVHPRFEKNEELESTKAQLGQVKITLMNLEENLKKEYQKHEELSENNQYMEERLVGLKNEYKSAEEQLRIKEEELFKIKHQLEEARKNAVEAQKEKILTKILNKVININVFRSKEGFDLKQYVLSETDECTRSSNEYENRACEVIREYADAHIKPGARGYEQLVPAFSYEGQ